MPLFYETEKHIPGEHFYCWAPPLREIVLLSYNNTYNCFLFYTVVPVYTIMMIIIHNNNDNC